MVTKICPGCGGSFSYEPVHIEGRELFARFTCEPCSTRQMEHLEQERAAERRMRRKIAWEEICPPLYRATDATRIPARFAKAAEGWSYSPRGLGLIGPAGKGKTRAAYLLLQRHFFEGRRCAAITSPELARLCSDQFSDNKRLKEGACDRIRACRQADILLIDDLGKCKMTERCEMELFDLLEHRTSQLLPTIWTANARGDELLAMLSPDRGEPILRRLAEFSEIVTV